MTKLLISLGFVKGRWLGAASAGIRGQANISWDRPLDKGNAASGNESLPRRAHA